MRCPYCGSLDTQVKDSRPTDDSSSIRRRRICPDCCACKASGQATAEPPTSVMKSRRLMERPYGPTTVPYHEAML